MVNASEKSDKSPSATAAPPLREQKEAPKIRNIFRGLGDVRFHATVTPQMITSIYILLITVAVLLCLALAVQASVGFGAKGIPGIVILVPAILLGTVVTARVVLEFVLTMFIVRTRVDEIHDSVTSVPGISESMTAVAEQMTTVAEKIGTVAEKITTITEQVTAINERVGTIVERVGAIVENTNNIPGQMAGLPSDQLRRGWQAVRDAAQGTGKEAAESGAEKGAGKEGED
jgi:Domain of unknown function (DUF4282)